MLLALLGREPELSLAELEAVLGSEAVTRLDTQAVLLATDASAVPFAYLGGTIRVARVVEQFENTQWKKLAPLLLQRLEFCQLFSCAKDHMFSLGMSVYGQDVPPRDITGIALKLKKKFRAESPSHKLRVVPNTTPQLSSARVLHNRLYQADNGAEIILYTAGSKTYLALTEYIQDIEAYSRRDYGRPCRDARIGMLPPKLAQIILNLAAGQLKDEKRPLTVLDPFCGSGVVLQEATLRGMHAVGTDIDGQMVDCADKNLRWLQQHIGREFQIDVSTADALREHWKDFDIIASEMYLGPPLERLPAPPELDHVVTSADQLLRGFLSNLAIQTDPDFRFCVAVPAWQEGVRQFRTLPLLERLEAIGYTWVQFSQVDTTKLFYARPEQLVARQLATPMRI